MTTLNDAHRRTATTSRADAPTVEVFGVAWPVYKVHALLAGLIAVAVVLLAGGTGVLAMWASAAAVLLIWWGERAALSARWDDVARDRHART